FEDEPNGLATAAESAPDEHAGSPEVREMLREQLVQLRESGKPRPDAERFLTRFTQGERHLDLLDEIYSDNDETKPSASRSRTLRRRRATAQQVDEQPPEAALGDFAELLCFGQALQLLQRLVLDLP